MRKLLLGLLLLGLSAACARPATPGGETPPPANTLTHVKLAMGYLPDIQFAPFYIAETKGYFKAQGIEIEFAPLFENESVPLLGANELQFAVVSAEEIIQARAQGAPVTYVMKWWEKYPIAIVSKAAKGFKLPKDLAGHKVGIPGLYGASYIGWQAMLNAEGLPNDTAQLETIGFNQLPALTAGSVDAAVVYANNEPVQLAAMGESVNTIYVSDYVQLASNGLATNEQTIKDHPALVQGMVTAILQGLKDTLANPDEGVEVSKAYVEALGQGEAASLTTARKVLAASIEMWKSDQPGVSDPARWAVTQSVLLKMGLIPAPINLDEAVTNKFVK